MKYISKNFPKAILLVSSIFLFGCDWGIRLSKIEEKVSALEDQSSINITSIDKNSQSISSASSEILSLDRKISALRNETMGIGNRNISLAPSSSMKTLFGNQSGRNASITVSNITTSRGKGDVFIRVVRIERPSDSLDDNDSVIPPDALPPDMEMTEELDLSQQGASRQLMVPCGFQLEGRSSYASRINLRIELSSTECASE